MRFTLNGPRRRTLERNRMFKQKPILFLGLPTRDLGTYIATRRHSRGHVITDQNPIFQRYDQQDYLDTHSPVRRGKGRSYPMDTGKQLPKSANES